MSLEKLFSPYEKFKRIRNILAVLSLGAFLYSCSSPSPSPSPSPQPEQPESEEPAPQPEESVPEESNSELGYDYTTTTTTLSSKYIEASVGGTIEITDIDSFIQGTKLSIPAGALTSDAMISVGRVDNPPALPEGLNYIGPPVNLESDRANLNTSATITIPYTDGALSDAGISNDWDLKLYYYDKSINNKSENSPGTWKEINIASLDTDNNIITAEIINLSTNYAITGCFDIPEDLGTPQPGDLLYKLGLFFDDGNVLFKNAWMPGHVGIYVGEKVDKEGNKYNVIEALWKEGVTRNYFNPISKFSREDVYMGAREPKNFTLTQQQREDIVDFVEAQVGKPYVKGETWGVLFGMLKGSEVKGPESFNCVGLAEKAYEEAGINDGEGLVSYLKEELTPSPTQAALTPAEQYNQTKPASVGCKIKIPIVCFTQDYSDYQIAVMNEDGSELHEITSDSLKKNYPRLSPDRNKIIFELMTKDDYSNDVPNLYTMNLDGSEVTELRLKSMQPSWSSKDKIAFVSAYGFQVIYLFDISDPSNQGNLINEYAVQKTPSFSPDGNSLVCYFNNQDIIQVDIETKNYEILIQGDKDNYVYNKEPEFSPDGKKIAFYSNMYERNKDIYLYDVDSKDIQRLTTRSSSETSPHFSKDGSKIFFVSDRDYTYQIYSMNLDGSEQKQLTFKPKNHNFGDWQ